MTTRLMSSNETPLSPKSNGHRSHSSPWVLNLVKVSIVNYQWRGYCQLPFGTTKIYFVQVSWQKLISSKCLLPRLQLSWSWYL